MNLSEELRVEKKDDDESWVGRVKQSFLPIILTLIFIAFFGVVLYRYLWMLNNPKVMSNENVPKIPSLQKHLPYEDNKTPVPPITPVKELIDIIKPLESKAQTPKIKINEYPQKLWIFEKSNKDSNPSYNDYMRNWEHYSKLSNLSVQKITKENYKTFI